MKKMALICATMATLPTVVLADSSVTLYGVVDGGYAYRDQVVKFSGSGGASQGRIETTSLGFRHGLRNGNRWGLRGKEDLGNGTSAIFAIESGFNLGTGESLQGGRLFGRQSFVGLSGDSWGSLTLGRQYNISDAFVQLLDPFGHNGWQSSTHAAFNLSHSYRYDNMLKYVSPALSGFRFAVGGFYQESKTTRYDVNNTETLTHNRDKGFIMGMGYRKDGFTIGMTMDTVNQTVKNTINAVNRHTRTQQWNVGMSYDFKVITLYMLYGLQRDGTFFGMGLADYLVNPQGKRHLSSALNGKGFRQYSWMVGLSVPVSAASNIVFSYQGNAIKNPKANQYENARIRTDVYSLGYIHNLSKRTNMSLIASYGLSALNMNDVLNQKRRLKAMDVQLGLQHRF